MSQSHKPDLHRAAEHWLDEGRVLAPVHIATAGDLAVQLRQTVAQAWLCMTCTKQPDDIEACRIDNRCGK